LHSFSIAFTHCTIFYALCCLFILYSFYDNNNNIYSILVVSLLNISVHCMSYVYYLCVLSCVYY